MAVKKETTEVVEEPQKPEPTDEKPELETRLLQLEKRASDQDRAISRKEKENQELRAQLDDRTEDKAFKEAMLGYLASVQNRPVDEIEEDVKRSQPDFVQRYKTTVEETRKQRQQESFSKVASDLQQRITALGFTLNTPEHYEVFGRLAYGDVEGAQKRVEELEGVKSGKQETKQVDVEELVEERARKLLEERGQLVTETGTPSSGGSQVWTTGEVENMTPVEYKKNFPTYADFLKAVNEGKIKE